MRPYCVKWVVLALALDACGSEPRRSDSAASIAGWTAGEGEDTRPASRTLQAAEPAPASSPPPRSRVLGGGPIVRRGERVDVRFREAEVREAMRLLAEVAGVDLVMDEGLTGTITLELRDVLPLAAMEAIAAAHGASIAREGRLVVVRPR